MFGAKCLNSAEELRDAEDWLRKALAAGEVESGAFLTRWNADTKQVEFIIGEAEQDGI